MIAIDIGIGIAYSLVPKSLPCMSMGGTWGLRLKVKVTIIDCVNLYSVGVIFGDVYENPFVMHNARLVIHT